jgi:hypothetical protein
MRVILTRYVLNHFITMHTQTKGAAASKNYRPHAWHYNRTILRLDSTRIREHSTRMRADSTGTLAFHQNTT